MVAVPEGGFDPYSFEIPERKKRVRSRKKDEPHSLVKAAYNYLRRCGRLHAPIASISVQDTVFECPEWAIRRALTLLVKDGILRGPEPVQKEDSLGRPVAFDLGASASVHISSWHSSTHSVIWIEGEWRECHYYSYEGLLRRAKAAESLSRGVRKAAVRKQAGRERRRSRFRVMEVPDTGKSRTGILREYARTLKPVRWDGMAFFPVPGPAFDELMRWRDSFPSQEEEDEARRKRENVKCARCGVMVPRNKDARRRYHSRQQCNVIVVEKVMSA